MFVQPGNTSFSGFNTAAQGSLFGQSAFGKPITTTSFGSGATPVFGSSNTSLFSSKPTGSATGGLFGNTTTSPAFRQPTNTQQSFGGFGTTNTSTNLFGTQQNANTNLFGTTPTPSAFGQSNKPSGFSFGTTSGSTLFGQPQQTAQQTTPFGQTNTTGNTNLFGSTSGFGATTPATTMTGTVVKFTPVITTESMSKNGISHTISARHCCIASMKEYESKSYEELRFEDYQVGRKGPQTGLFGAPAQPFGSTPAGTNTSTTGFGGMTGFGPTSQAGSTNLFGKPTNFGTPSTSTTSTFAFNSTPSTNLFGSNTQAKPFGTAAPTPLFATSNANQTSGTAFGGLNTTQNTGFGAGFGATQPNQSVGLFNQNKSAFNVPSTSSGTAFSTFGQAPATNAGSALFGAKPAGTTTFGTGSTFGGTTAPAFGTTTGFTAGQNSGSLLFNPPFKPAGQTTGFSFGTTSTPSTGLGTNTNLTLGSGTSLFGQQKPGGLFGTTGGSTTFNTPAFGSSSFGTMSTMGTGGGVNLLGGGSATNQGKPPGSVPVHQQILALVSAPFGDSPLLKNLLPASGKTEELLKPANAASRMMNSPQYKVTTNSKSPKVKTRVVSAAQLSKKSLFEGLEEEDPALSEAFHPRPNAKRLVLRPKPILDSPDQSQNENLQSTSKNGSKDERPEITNFGSHDDTIDKENHIQQNNRDYAKDRRSTTSWLKSALPEKPHRADESYDGQWSPFTRPSLAEESINNTVSELRPNTNSVAKSSPKFDANHSAEAPNNASFAEKSADVTAHNSDSSQELEDSSFSALQTNWTSNAAKVTLRRVGYYTIPSLDKLDEYVSGEACVVPNFTVGRDGYGNVYFPDSFDIYGLNLDEIVHFRHKEVIIYPDDEKKPPVGQGLNRRAQVTLDRVWPHDKSLHEPITDPHRLAAMNYEGKLRRVSAKHDTRFLEYRPETGSWVFKVDHFSKYGLSDSDEEDSAPPPPNDPKKFKSNVVPNRLAHKIEQFKVLTKQDRMSNGETVDDAKMVDANQSDLEELFLGDSVISQPLTIGDYTRDRQLPVSPTGDHARILGTDSHKLQLMKASFFDTTGDEIDREPNYISQLPESKNTLRYYPEIEKIDDRRLEITQENISRSNLTIRHTNYPMYSEEAPLKKDIKLKQQSDDVITDSPVHTKRLPDPVITPATAILKYHTEVIPLQDSLINKLRSRCIADKGIQMGRMFRPSWGRGLTLVTLSTQRQATNIQLDSPFHQLGSYLSGRVSDDTTSTTVVQRLQILGGEGADQSSVQLFKESIEGHLKIQLSNCIVGQEGECPVFDVSRKTATAALHAHCTLAQTIAEQSSTDRFATYVANVWKLCVALWGNLPDINVSTGNMEHHNVMVRREAIGEWLKNVVRETVEREIADVAEEEKIILLLLSALKLEEACEIARNAGDHCLALLMAQLRSGMPVKKLVRQQIALWQETEVDADISMDRLKLFTLVAGEPLICSKHGTINVCEGLDWKRALAVHLWYLASPIASIRDALELYQASFEAAATEVYSAAPIPEYKNTDYDIEVNEDRRPIYDLCFHLLKLYCTGDHVLGELLNPPTHTADPLDYRLSWLMQQVLVALGYAHLPEDVAALIHTNFSTQLEAYGLWHWAIFVALHLRDVGRRQTAVMDLLQRYVEVDDVPEYVEREQFLREELGIPSTWIHRAKAIKSRVSKRYGEAAWYYIQAEQWSYAHEIIIEHLAADAIINDNYDYLRTLLEPLTPPECCGTVSGWPYQGQLLWDYMEITKDIQSLLRISDPRAISYKLELLKPRLTSLCSKIGQFPCPSAKHRLCQAEIAKRTLHLARNLLLLQTNENRSKTLLYLISQLPLPEDYSQQELRLMVNMRVNEVITQTA